MTRGKCTTYPGHCRNVFASMLSMNAGRKWTSCGKHWTTGSRNRDIEEDACCRRHTSNAVSQTVEARCCPPETSNTGQRGVRRLPNAVIKGFELVLETGGKLLGKSSNRFSLLPLRWTALLQGCTTPYRQTWPVHARRGQTLFFLSGQQKSYSSRLRRNSGGRGTQVETFVEDARALANAWTRQMEQNEVFLEPVIKRPYASALYFRSECRGMGWEPHIRKSAFRKRSCSCRPHTTGALHHPT